MIETVQFRPEHLWTLTPQPEQRAELAAAQEASLEGDGWSVQKDAKTLACAILVELGDGRAAVLAFIGADAGPHMTTVFRVADRMFDMSAHRRIEATVLADFAAGARWMRLLHFELETPNGMKKFGPRGETYLLYARVR